MGEFAVHRWGNDHPASCAGKRPSALVIAVDTLVCGVHFVPQTAADAIGYKAVAVNLSDLAAMGATPKRGLVSLLLPPTGATCVPSIRGGCDAIAAKFGIRLNYAVFSAKTLALTVELHGYVDPSTALRRSAARIGDIIYVSGTLGDASAGLGIRQGHKDASNADQRQLLARLDYPRPRVGLGQALRGVARCAIDLSDGLCQDLVHVLKASNVSARIAIEQIPLSSALIRTRGVAAARRLALNAGDDYELCFTAAASQKTQIESIGARFDCRLQPIGHIVARTQPLLSDGNGGAIHAPKGFDHFRG